MMTLETVAARLAHDDGWHAERARGLGGSDASRIMAGDWTALWMEKTGRQEPEDLSGVLQVQLGKWTEAFNAAWFVRQTGLPLVLGEDCAHLVHPQHGFMRCNIDGRVGLLPFEAKHVSAFAKDEEILTRYYAQCQHNLAVCAASRLYLSVLFGNHKWAFWEIEPDAEYQAQLIKREVEFWGYVVQDKAPPNTDEQHVEIALDDMREEDMGKSNAWAQHASDWLENAKAAKAFKTAETEIKALVAADVKRAHGHGIECKRAKNGALTIRVEKT